ADGRALILASDLNNRWNDFPLHPTFVAFLHEAVRYLSSARPYADEYLIGDAPAAVSRVPGVATLPIGSNGSHTRRVVVNVDPREADPARVSVEDFQAAVMRMKDVGASQARVEATEQEERQHLWRYAFLLMLAVLVAESAVAARTG